MYGAEKVWVQLNRQDIAVARCTVERLMSIDKLAASQAALGGSYVASGLR